MGRRFKYRLSTTLPPASIISDRNRTCWWHLNLLRMAFSSSSNCCVSIIACMNHSSPSLGGWIGNGLTSIVTENKLTFSHIDFSHKWVTHCWNLWYWVWNGWIESPSSITMSSNETSIIKPRLDLQPKWVRSFVIWAIKHSTPGCGRLAPKKPLSKVRYSLHADFLIPPFLHISP